MVIAAGPGGEPGAGVRAAVRLLLRDRPAGDDDARGRAIEKGYPGRRRSSSRATSWSPSTACAATPSALSRQIQTHRCPGEPDGRLQGRHARRRCWSSATAARLTLKLTPVYDASRGRTAHAARLRLRARRAARDAAGRRGASTSPPTASGSSPRRRSSCRLRLIDPEQRKEITGVVGSYEATRQTILNDLADVVGHPRDHLALAGDREPVPVPAARRRPHLLGDRREGARASRCRSA